jgi:hypothetical protein
VVLADAIRRQSGEWSSRRAHRLYRAIGAAPGRRTARRDLAHLHHTGLLVRHDAAGLRYYTRKDGRS